MLQLRILKGLIRSRPSSCRKRKLKRGWFEALIISNTRSNRPKEGS